MKDPTGDGDNGDHMYDNQESLFVEAINDL